MEHKSRDDWVSACRNVTVVGVRGRGEKTWYKCVKEDMKVLEKVLHAEWAVFIYQIMCLVFFSTFFYLLRWIWMDLDTSFENI